MIKTQMHLQRRPQRHSVGLRGDDKQDEHRVLAEAELQLVERYNNKHTFKSEGCDKTSDQHHYLRTAALLTATGQSANKMLFTTE